MGQKPNKKIFFQVLDVSVSRVHLYFDSNRQQLSPAAPDVQSSASGRSMCVINCSTFAFSGLPPFFVFSFENEFVTCVNWFIPRTRTRTRTRTGQGLVQFLRLQPFRSLLFLTDWWTSIVMMKSQLMFVSSNVFVSFRHKCVVLSAFTLQLPLYCVSTNSW